MRMIDALTPLLKQYGPLIPARAVHVRQIAAALDAAQLPTA